MKRPGIFNRLVSASAVSVALVVSARAEAVISDIEDPPHNYRQRPLRDPFTTRLPDLISGKIALDRSSEKAFVASLLQALEVPASSQMLVFSTTSLQLSLISPSNPRALYFNEDVYLGFVPGGRVETVSLDPDLGGIFYIFDVPRGDRPLAVERSERCMNCHSRDDTGQVPGLVVKSVIPGPGGGSLTAYRLGASGHGIPWIERFGGWVVTGADAFTNHLGNLTGVLANGKLTRLPNPPGARFSFSRYLAPESDILPQLLHEHQVGFVNRVLVGTYLARQYQTTNAAPETLEQQAELDAQAKVITRYLLFADEAPLPPGGVLGSATFKADFLRTRRAGLDGRSLKDLDLKTRLFRHRCSYMIYSTVFAGLPAPMKQRIYRRLAAALDPEVVDPDSSHLSADEKRAIREILRATLSGLPAGW